MTINEELIREVLLQSTPGDLDDVLTAIEAYRICARTAERLRRSSEMTEQREQVEECAQYCETLLTGYVATGVIKPDSYPVAGFGLAYLNIVLRN